MSQRTLQSILGVLLIVAGVVGWYVLPERSEYIVGALLVIGGFLVSKSAMVEVAATILKLLKARSA